ncbi:hypothetical protein S40285_07418 [Stachybotrys chlorohalonatus IBT 40285]|uniref:Heterokaryon incompatibility domain-containing protein n=1 Tax=Stachybotrys chlorohalonatus (strain IBT 40285) TaxID=1283841 RepID=A0A084QZ76_STAC4|nr:hypothetical protein S40285_07418 [Stachybotrys chlorohalonata IBT 40285]
MYPPLHGPRTIRLLKFIGVQETTRQLHYCLESWPEEVSPVTSATNVVEAIREHKRKHSYYALSYVWGDASCTRSIVCNGLVLDITLNLYEALVQMSTEDPDRMLWVDSLCINQGNLEEKSSQVRMMSDIFACARDVICWLGNAQSLPLRSYEAAIIRLHQIYTENPDHRAMRSQGTHHIRCKQCRQIIVLPTSTGGCTDSIHDISLKKCFGLEDLLQAMLNSSWFTRVWTFQEFLLASVATLHMGPYSISWDCFMFACHYVGEEHGWVIKGMDKFREDLWRGRARSLASLVNTTQKRQASILHDRIFAVIGLSLRAQSSSLEIDYTVPIEQLYAAVTRYTVLEDDNLNVLRTTYAQATAQHAVMGGGLVF